MTMITAEQRKFACNNHEVELNEDGFIRQPELWDASLALALAQADGVSELTEAHWKVIRYIRAYFEKHQTAPTIREMCRETGFPLREMYELFPSGPTNGACRVAGLPKPKGCV